jgi:hypothetical protein
VFRKAIGAIAASACSQAVELPEIRGGVKPCCTKAHQGEHSLLRYGKLHQLSLVGLGEFINDEQKTQVFDRSAQTASW